MHPDTSFPSASCLRTILNKTDGTAILTSWVGKEAYPQAHSGAEWTQDSGPLPSITIPPPQPPAMAGSVMVPTHPLGEVTGSSDLSSPSSRVFRGSLKPLPQAKGVQGGLATSPQGLFQSPEPSQPPEVGDLESEHMALAAM